MNDITTPLPTICGPDRTLTAGTDRRAARITAARRTVNVGVARLLHRHGRAGPLDTPSREALAATGVPDMTR